MQLVLDLKCLVNWQSIFAIFQEIGRAGRDGQPSVCKIFHSPSGQTLHFACGKQCLNLYNEFQFHKYEARLCVGYINFDLNVSLLGC